MDFKERYQKMDPYTRRIIDSLIAGINAHQSQMLVGNPGMGKSALVNDLAKNFLHAKVITVIGSQKEPTDVTGFPRLVTKALPDGKAVSVTDYAVPSWQFSIMQERKKVLFLDEFSNSTPAVQAAMLQILNERVFPNLMPVPPQTVIIGAMNPVETAADGYTLAPPVANRIKFLPWEPTYESWRLGFLSNWGNPDAVSEQEMQWRKIIASFLDDNASLRYKLPDEKTNANPGATYNFGDSPAELDIYKTAYPSYRSWSNLARELPYCEKKDTRRRNELIALSAKGLVGYEACRAFLSFVTTTADKLPPVRVILQSPSKVDWNNLDGNQKLTIIRNVMDVSAKDEALLPAVADLFIFLSANGNQNIISDKIDTLIRSLSNHGYNKAAARVMDSNKNLGRNIRNRHSR